MTKRVHPPQVTEIRLWKFSGVRRYVNVMRVSIDLHAIVFLGELKETTNNWGISRWIGDWRILKLVQDDRMAFQKTRMSISWSPRNEN